MNTAKILASALIPLMLGACSGESAMEPSADDTARSDNATVLDDNPLLTASLCSSVIPPLIA